MTAEPRSERTRVKRLAARADYDPTTVRAVVDEALVAHVAVTTPQGPIALPMAYGRIGDTLYLHGAAANALLKAASGRELAATITLLDGLVLARSAFHHSMNYRSIVVRGPGRSVDDPDEKQAALAAIVDHATPGRSASVRPPSPVELRATHVLALELTESSAKIRTGPPVDDEEDLDLPVWAGVVPLALTRGAPVRHQHQPGPRPIVA